MPRKVFQVQVELDVHAVTCPGVWLCPCGKLSLQIYMLDSCVQTISVEPEFPLGFGEKFLFYKIFDKAQRLSDLQRFLSKECLYIELIQWVNSEMGNVLASFATPLSEALFPVQIAGVYAGVDVDLLMEPSPTFPGIIAPKIEVSTKTTIEESLCTQQHKRCSAFVVNPKVVASSIKTRPPCVRQKKVCHSVGYHKSRKYRSGAKMKQRPPFQYRRADDGLLTRTPKGLDPIDSICKCRKKCEGGWELTPRTFTDLTEDFLQSYVKSSANKLCPSTGRSCICGKAGHSNRTCPVCAKYNNVFENTRCACATNKVKVPSVNGYKCNCRSLPLSTVELTEVSPYKKEKSIRRDTHVTKPCHCTPHKQSSAAESIHRKLSEMSSSSSTSQKSQNYYQESPTISMAGSWACASPKIYSTSQFQKKFYDSLEKFYRNLYKKAEDRGRITENLCTC